MLQPYIESATTLSDITICSLWYAIVLFNQPMLIWDIQLMAMENQRVW